jgi:S-phase kinase-associated protein 1
MITIVSSDDKYFTINDEVAMDIGNLVSTYIDENYDDSNNMTIPVPNISSDILELVIQFTEHYIANPNIKVQRPIVSKTDMSENVEPKIFMTFIDNVPKDKINQLALAASFIDNTDLLNLVICKMATLIWGKSLEEMKEFFVGYV